MSRHHIESFWKIGRTALGTEHQPTCIANMFLQVQKQEILPKNSSFWKTLQNSSSKIPICLQFSFAHVSHIWRLQPRHRMKKKLVKTCCLMRKSSLKQWRRLQVAVNIDQQNDAVSDSCLFPELLYFQELPSVPGVHNEMYKFLDTVALMKGNQAKALGIYCLVQWDCSEVDIFQLENCWNNARDK